MDHKNGHKKNTLKMHVLFQHLKHCRHFLNNARLGIWSEQAGESIHREFLRTSNQYKLNFIEHPSYIERFKKAVVEFSVLRI